MLNFESSWSESLSSLWRIGQFVNMLRLSGPARGLTGPAQAECHCGSVAWRRPPAGGLLGPVVAACVPGTLPSSLMIQPGSGCQLQTPRIGGAGGSESRVSGPAA
jgi:hypothetical protein